MKSRKNISHQCVVSLTWVLKDTLGEVLDELDEPVEFLVGGQDLLAKIEDALQGHVAGDTVEVHLEPLDAFGDYDDQLLFLEPRHLFPDDIEEGMGFEGLPEGCTSQAPRDRLYFVSDIYPDHVVMDGNHPLAGVALRVKLKVHAVREAELDEVGRGTLGTGFFRMPTGDAAGDTSEGASAPTLH
ncbi:MAG TPA: peptidylprolyl isomerase [Hydrogenophaga sp.]|uniref:FKBP-type peptidyl-prolyl cis-trans isomerase n=1 Tax=Hydrogenophaga sp. TaxID=1904254 RepID=UPI002BD363E0|nr:peptidylprolyl isomerase [Hydrogenophaga sp.]HMN93197.1 peptidylprolyl isomerase [Hydrogenophaga sp.]HMP12105.1 peptidylprolyl isomerase [Hydrogenophaga sp.]